MSRRLPDFPWDTIAAARQRAGDHPGGLVDLSVGTPVDPTPAPVRQALCAADDSPGYPQTWGTPRLRRAIAGYHASRWGGVPLTDEGVLPVVGTKELVAGLALQLDLGPDDTVVVPGVAYPTYAVGAAMTGSDVVTADTPAELGDRRPALVWVNSPANPSGWTQGVAELRAWVDWCRERDAVLASDECYAEFGWEADPASVLQPQRRRPPGRRTLPAEVHRAATGAADEQWTLAAEKTAGREQGMSTLLTARRRQT